MSTRFDDRAWERLRDMLELVAFLVVVALIWLAIPLPEDHRRHHAAATLTVGAAPDRAPEGLVDPDPERAGR